MDRLGVRNEGAHDEEIQVVNADMITKGTMWPCFQKIIVLPPHMVEYLRSIDVLPRIPLWFWEV